MDNTTNTLAEQSKLRRLVNSYGVPRLIITGFLLLMFILAPVAGVDFATQITNVINRFSWNAIMVLAMVPMIHSGCGLNFGLPLGIISGLLGATLSIEFGFTGGMSFLMAIVIATPFALVLGGGYGWMLNKIKGGEMMVATYVGFSSVSFMCMMWLLLPYKSPTMVWGFAGKGLRTTISLEGFYDQFLAKFLQIDLNRFGINLVIPTGSLLFFALLAFLMWVFLHTKTGTAMTAVGSNPTFAKVREGAKLAREHNVIMDGRDIGTVVLPDADVKVFLTAGAEARAMRRLKELEQRGQRADYQTILAEIIQRDRQDSLRSAAPLKQAEDAVLLDTTHLDLTQTVDALLNIARGRIPM